MNVLMLCGDHLRHRYFSYQLSKTNHICGVVVQRREPPVPSEQLPTSGTDSSLLKRHFEARQKAEKYYFADTQTIPAETLNIEPQQWCAAETIEFLSSRNADIALVFGTALLPKQVRGALPKETLNLHLGISPEFKGAATLFWPFYFQKPGWAGATFHYLSDRADSGDIVHQVLPQLDITDGIHDVGAKTVLESIQGAQHILHILERTGKLQAVKQTGSGKTFKSNDFKPSHLRVIYELFNDDMVRASFDGEVDPSRPEIFTQKLGCLVK